ncbi:MAG: hypothetical protein IT422_20045 [Pirellulaceae bacterium]|nr:hypothetical protein [Pirellulaceae bacterium]
MTTMTKPTQKSAAPAPIFLSIPRKVILGLCAGAVLGAVLALLSAVLYSGGMRRVMLAYLVAFAFVLSLSLGSLFFVLIQHLMRASWGVLVRRPAEIFSLNVISVAILFLPIAWWVVDGSGQLYPWAKRDTGAQLQHAGEGSQLTPIAFAQVEESVTEANASHSHSPEGVPREPHTTSTAEAPHNSTDSLYIHQTVDSLTRSKQGWLNPGAYLVRSVVFFGVWIGIATFYFVRSRNLDRVGGVSDTRRMEWWAGVSVFAFGITLTYAAFDMLMSLDPHWYSTIFGVYFFAGCAVGGFSVNLLSILVLQQLGILPSIVSEEHRRDLGRLLFAFVFFWGYIAFSQYMLLWYANVPETTRWFVVRGASMAEGYSNSWGYLAVLLLFGHFIIPFLGIMSRHVKSNPRAMLFWAGWLLLMHYLDLVWLVMPELSPRLTIGLPEVGTLLFVTCAYLLGASLIATRTSIIPTGDPRLGASLAVTEVY